MKLVRCFRLDEALIVVSDPVTGSFPIDRQDHRYVPV